jgi:putative toxin-antitoxin system antitoxin component (TIGR02293 family)
VEAPTAPALPLDQLDGLSVLALGPGDPVAVVRAGMPFEAFVHLAGTLAQPVHRVAAAAGIPARTLTRRRQEGRLNPEESDRVLRLARTVELTLAVFEDSEAARTWLTTPKRLLGGEAPLEHAGTGPGARAVEAMLYAIEFTAAA